MSGVLLRAAGLAAIYLLVLTSLDPGDVIVGAALGLPSRWPCGHTAEPSFAGSSGADRLAGCLAGMLIETAREMVVGSWRVVRFCLGGPARPASSRSRAAAARGTSVALWGVLTGEAPDEVPVDVDEARDVLIVHLVDAGDPDAVRAATNGPTSAGSAGGALMPDVVLTVAFGWATLLLVGGGLLLLRAQDALHRILALDVLVGIVIALLTILSYVDGVSYYIDAALALALLSFTATLVAARYVLRGRQF